MDVVVWFVGLCVLFVMGVMIVVNGGWCVG